MKPNPTEPLTLVSDALKDNSKQAGGSTVNNSLTVEEPQLLQKMQQLPIRKFTVDIITVPPRIECELLGSKPERKAVTIVGYTLKDAKRRAGIQ